MRRTLTSPHVPDNVPINVMSPIVSPIRMTAQIEKFPSGAVCKTQDDTRIHWFSCWKEWKREGGREDRSPSWAHLKQKTHVTESGSGAVFKCSFTKCVCAWLLLSVLRRSALVICYTGEQRWWRVRWCSLHCSSETRERTHPISSPNPQAHFHVACWDTLVFGTFEWIPDPRLLVREVLS